MLLDSIRLRDDMHLLVEIHFLILCLLIPQDGQGDCVLSSSRSSQLLKLLLDQEFLQIRATRVPAEASTMWLIS